MVINPVNSARASRSLWLICALAILVGSFFGPAKARAAITDVSFTGAFSTVNTTISSLKVNIGRASASGFSCTTSNVCDSCAGDQSATAGTPASCNNRFVSTTGNLDIQFTAASAGFPKVISTVGTTSTLIKGSTTSTAASAISTLSVPISDLCNALGATSSCSTDVSGTVQVGVNKDDSGSATLTESANITVTVTGNTASAHPTTTCGGLTTDLGLCDYDLKAGDEKAFVITSDLSSGGTASNNMPTGPNGLFIDHVRFYYVERDALGACSSVSATEFTNATSQYRELSVNHEGGSSSFLDNDILTDLTNDKVYCFRAANVDEAGNIGYWTTPIKEVDPSEVIGYFTEEKNCFVATAAYGSPLESHVETFRQFRNQVLLPTKVGRDFVGFYYSHAYEWGKVIKQDERLKFLVRIVLWPIWVFAQLSLAITWPATMALIALVFAALVFIGRRKNNGLTKYRFFILIFAILMTSLIQSRAVAAVERKPAAERPPREAPYDSNEEEDDNPTPLKTPKAKVEATQDPKGPVLLRITKDGEYLYKRKASPQKNSSSLRFGNFQIGSAFNPETNLSFSEIYGDSGTIMFFDYEWQFLKSVGKLGFKLGTGVFTAQGNGRFRNNVGTQAEEKYTFVMFPNNASLVYRAQYWRKQFLVPYVEGGGGYYTFAEVRDDFKRTKIGGVPIIQWAAGISFLLDFLDPKGLVELDEDMGINHLWLTAEYRGITSYKDNFDISNDVFSAGFLFEF